MSNPHAKPKTTKLLSIQTMFTLKEVKPLEHYRLWVSFSNGTEGVVDLSDLAGQGVFEIWNDYQQFRQVSIGSGGEAVWSDQADICPDALYLRLTGKRPEDIFPNLRELTEHARD